MESGDEAGGKVEGKGEKIEEMVVSNGIEEG